MGSAKASANLRNLNYYIYLNCVYLNILFTYEKGFGGDYAASERDTNGNGSQRALSLASAFAVSLRELAAKLNCTPKLY